MFAKLPASGDKIKYVFDRPILYMFVNHVRIAQPYYSWKKEWNTMQEEEEQPGSADPFYESTGWQFIRLKNLRPKLESVLLRSN